MDAGGGINSAIPWRLQALPTRPTSRQKRKIPSRQLQGPFPDRLR